MFNVPGGLRNFKVGNNMQPGQPQQMAPTAFAGKQTGFPPVSPYAGNQQGMSMMNVPGGLRNFKANMRPGFAPVSPYAGNYEALRGMGLNEQNLAAIQQFQGLLGGNRGLGQMSPAMGNRIGGLLGGMGF